MKANDLRKKRAAIVQEMKGLLDVADAEKRELSDVETKRYAELDDEQKRMVEKIAEREKLEGRQAELDREMREVPSESRAERPGENLPAERVDPAKQFRSFGEFLTAVRMAGSPGGQVDPRLSTRAASGMSESVPSDGGYLVQQEMANEILTRVYSGGAIASRVRRIPISAPNSNGLKIPAVNEVSRVDGSRWGGIQAFWTDEAGLKAGSFPTFRTLSLSLKKLTGLCYSTDELLQDAAALEAVITQGFNEEITFKVEDAIINGVGPTTQPLGIMNSGALVTVPIETGQTIANSAASLATNAAKMMARMPARNYANAVWLVNQALMPSLVTMTLGGAAGVVPVFMPGGSMASSPYGSLLGRPVIPSEHQSAVGTPGDILLADLSEYILIDKGGVKSDVSIHVRFIYDETTFRFVYRCDGLPTWNAPLTPYKGTATQSPYVALAART